MPETAVSRVVERTRPCAPGNPQVDPVTIDHIGITVVGHITGDDRYDACQVLRRVFETELRPRALVCSDLKTACIERRPQSWAHPGIDHEISIGRRAERTRRVVYR